MDGQFQLQQVTGRTYNKIFCSILVVASGRRLLRTGDNLFSFCSALVAVLLHILHIPQRPALIHSSVEEQRVCRRVQLRKLHNDALVISLALAITVVALVLDGVVV